jgi:Phosphate-selective porin O and P
MDGTTEEESRMRKLLVISGIAGLALLCLGVQEALAGAKLQINEKSSIDLGFRLQVLALSTDRDLDGDGQFDRYDEWRIRRARFRLKGTVNEHFSMFFQTDVTGNNIEMIDAYIELKKDDWLQLIVGQNMAPASRENLTSSGALMPIDRPGMTYKSLTWGVRALSTFNTATYGDSDSGIRGSYNVRDLGGTLFGSGKVGDKASLKYYVGTYNGIQAAGHDSERYAGRVQVNFGDAEGAFYNSATYLGKKKTVGVGVSYDTQKNVGSTKIPLADYKFLSADVFAEQPVGSGSLTVEAAYSDVDLGGAAPTVEGDGYYLQAGYLIGKKKWQPWFLYEDWTANAASGKGSYNLLRAGVSYFIAGQNANLKAGFEKFNADAPIGSSREDTINSLVFGFYTTY